MPAHQDHPLRVPSESPHSLSSISPETHRRFDLNLRCVSGEILERCRRDPGGITELYVGKFGVPPAGKRVFIQIVQQINRWQDQPQTFSARVLPA